MNLGLMTQALNNEYNNGIKIGIEEPLKLVITNLDELVGYYEQPQDRFEMGFRQGIYRAKMRVEEILKEYKES